MPDLRQLYERGRDSLQDAHAALTVGVGTVIVNAIASETLSVYPNDSPLKKAVLAYPSAFPADEVLGNQVADTVFQAGYSALSVGLVRNTTSRRGTIYTAAAAQGLACAANAAVEASGSLDKSEMSKKDVGFSSIFLAFTNKFLLDKWSEAKIKGKTAESRRYLGGLAVLDSGLTAGAYLVEKGQGGSLLLASHTAGIAVGVGAHLFGSFRQRLGRAHTEERLAAVAAREHNASPEDVLTSVDNR